MSSTSTRIDPEQLRTLMAKVATGDAEAFRKIYFETSSKLYWYAFRILQRHELVEEVLQETYITVWRSAICYQSNLSAPVTWITTILRNKAFDLLRTIKDAVEIDADNFDENVINSLVDIGLTPLEVLESNRLTYSLGTCIAQLESAHRQVVCMAFFEEMSHSEIAVQLNLPIGTVKTWIRRSLCRLETGLKKLEIKKKVPFQFS